MNGQSPSLGHSRFPISSENSPLRPCNSNPTLDSGFVVVFRLAGVGMRYALSLLKHTSISSIADRKIIGDSTPGEKAHDLHEY